MILALKWREGLGALFVLLSLALAYFIAKQPYAQAVSNLRWAFWTLLLFPILLGVQLVVYRIISGVRWSDMSAEYVCLPVFALWTAGLLVRTLDQTGTQTRVAEYTSTVLEVRGGKRRSVILGPFGNSTSPVSVLGSETRLFEPIPVGTPVRIIDEVGLLGIGTRQIVRATDPS